MFQYLRSKKFYFESIFKGVIAKYMIKFINKPYRLITNNEVINFNSFIGGCDQDILQMLDILKLNSGIGGQGAANNHRNNR